MSALLAQNNYIATSPLSFTPSSFNTFVGPSAGNPNLRADANTFIGISAGSFTIFGTRNTFAGAFAGNYNTASYNTMIGAYAGVYSDTGEQNAFLGYAAGQQNKAGSYNAFIGCYAGLGNTTGQRNTYLGGQAGFNSAASSSNTFVGYLTGYNTSSGDQNTFLGSEAGFANQSGGKNVYLGYQAGNRNQYGSNNIIIGPSSGTAITEGSDNVLMGYNSQAEDSLYNAIAIGANSRVAVSNALVLGNQVKVGIGTSAPTSKLDIVADEADQSGLRLSRLTNASRTTLVTDQFLTVNENGDVVKARYQLRINSPSEWSDNVFSPSYQLRPLSLVAAYIDQHHHLPSIPSAEEVAKEGIDLVKMNATLLEKVEELTLYSIQQEQTNQQQKAELQALKQKQAELEGLLNQLLKRK